MKKLSAAQIEEIQAHFTSDEVSFPLPDKKHVSEDLKHDVHLIKVFTNRSEQILKKVQS